MLQFRSNGGPRPLSLLHGFQHLLLYSTSSSTEKTHSFTDYLVDSLGFSKQQSLSLSAKLTHYRLIQGAKKVSDFDSICKSDTVISFLKQNGFDQSQIRRIVCFHPRILRSKIDKTLIPKFEFLSDQGFSGLDMVEFVTKNPVVVTLSLNSCTVPAFQALKGVLGDDESAIFTVKRMHHCSFLGAARNLVPNVALLQKHGISLESIRKHIIKQPNVYVQKSKSLEDVLIRVEEKWGIPRNSPMFLYGVNLLSSSSEEIVDSKVRVFKSFGWTESDVLAIMKKHPNCLALSEARIKKSLEFLMNELGYKADVIASRPTLLICSLEKRIIPRRKVLLVLKDKGLITREYSLYGLVTMSEALFMKKFVLPYKEVHEVYATLCGRPSQQGKADSHSQL